MAPRSTTPRSTRPDPVRPAPVVRDFRGSTASYGIEWDVRSVYDFVFSLSDEAGSTDDLPPSDRRWLADARAALPAAIQADRVALLGNELCIQIAELIVDRPGATTPAAFVEAVAALDRREAVHYLVGDLLHEPTTADLVKRALEDDHAALAELGTTMSEHRRDERIAVLQDPEGIIGRLVSVLHAWQRAFVEVEPRVSAMLQRDVDARAADARTLSPGDLIERTTGGLRYMAEPNVSRVILAPSYFARPYNFLFSRDEWRLYGYPIADSALDATDPLEPPPSVVRLHRALGDPSRLRILRLLADGDRYLTEIAQALELSKPTVKHHMAQLRAAGLATLTEEGSLTYYSLRRDRLDEVGDDLRRFITT
jgi:DNA-binding transcriptional ArsR family regulator